VGGFARLRLRIEGSVDPKTIEAERERFGGRLELVEGGPALLSEAALRKVEGLSLAIHVGASSIVDALARRDASNGTRIRWIIHAGDPQSMARCLRAFARKGADVSLGIRAWPGQADATIESLLIAVDYYLHDPALETPIRPLHDFLVGETSSSRKDLWELEDALPGRDYFIGVEGSVELWTEGREIRLGTTASSYDSILAAALGHSAKKRMAGFLAARSVCGFCGHCRFCGGYFEDGEGRTSCEAWKPAFAVLLSECARGKGEIGVLDARG
jgi:hypothetical protein